MRVLAGGTGKFRAYLSNREFKSSLGNLLRPCLKAKAKAKAKFKKKKSQRDNHNPARKGISATVLRSTSVAVCTPNPNTHKNIPLFLKWGDAAQFT